MGYLVRCSREVASTRPLGGGEFRVRISSDGRDRVLVFNRLGAELDELPPEVRVAGSAGYLDAEPLQRAADPERAPAELPPPKSPPGPLRAESAEWPAPSAKPKPATKTARKPARRASTRKASTAKASTTKGKGSR
ncbi:MAG: hypothetical protein AAGD06_21105 [Acidobacteriota bacterium]